MADSILLMYNAVTIINNNLYLLCAYCHNVAGFQSRTLETSWNGTHPVSVTAILNGQLFVIYNTVPQVSVYDTMSFQLLHQITFTGLGAGLLGLATSAINNYLYISDFSNLCVHRVDLSVTSKQFQRGDVECTWSTMWTINDHAVAATFSWLHLPIASRNTLRSSNNQQQHSLPRNRSEQGHMGVHCERSNARNMYNTN